MLKSLIYDLECDWFGSKLLSKLEDGRRRMGKDFLTLSPLLLRLTKKNTHTHTNTHIHRHTLFNVQVVLYRKHEFSVTNNINMRSDKNRKREMFYRRIAAKAQSA